MYFYTYTWHSVILFSPHPSKKPNLAEHFTGQVKTSAGNLATSCTPDSPFLSSWTEPQLCCSSATNPDLKCLDKTQNATSAFEYCMLPYICAESFTAFHETWDATKAQVVFFHTVQCRACNWNTEIPIRRFMAWKRMCLFVSLDHCGWTPKQCPLLTQNPRVVSLQ